MELLLLKSSACLLALLLFYKIALEPLSIHKFKRVYLLVAVIVAAIIPFITFIKYVDPTFTFPNYDANSITPPPFFVADAIVEEESISFLPTILWSVYLIGVSLFLIRFCINLFSIVSKIKKHTKVKSNRFVNVLMEQLEIPHTFFNFIFLNKTKFENNQIPAEVLLHEQTHAKQKHSLDIIIIELLQVVFWFNPLLYWLKKEVKLNHEFLADQNVIKQGVDTKTYQNILLQFSSNQQELALVNAINYSSIKKRFTLMKTHTSKKAVWLRSLLLLPLLAILLFSFSQTKEIEKEVVPKMKLDSNYVLTSTNTARNIDIKVFKNGTYEIDGIKANKNTFIQVINQLHQDINSEIRNNIINIHVDSPKDISDKEVWFIFNAVQDYGFYRIVAYNQEVIRPKGNTPFAIESKKPQDPKLLVNGIECDGCLLNLSKKGIANIILATTTKEDITAFKLKIPGVKTQNIKSNILSNEARGLVLKAKEGDYIQLFDIKSKSNTFKPVRIKLVDKTDKNYSNSPIVKKGEESSIPPPPPPANPNATPEEKAKQEKVINEYYKKNKIVNGKVLRNPPPPPPPAPEKVEKNTGFIKINGEQHFYAIMDGKTKYYNRWGVEVDKKGNKLSDKQTDGSKVIPGQKITKVYKDGKIVSEFNKTWEDDDMNIPPPPPPPMSTLDHIIKMAKKGASFYYNGDAITSDKAIDLVKKNNKLNISSHTNNGVATVNISENPIRTVNGKVVTD
ncbi:M56 family metallopeptidase [Olleya sp. R77988]|uniref:M56 family metallopeptidase n=1 Tax=Olleya sp. R77988 TaxID=3093875 RepID=UPI0037C9720A